MRIKFYGHSAFSIEHNGKTVLFDPFISDNPLTKIDPDTIKADIILLTHGHGDHVGDTVQIAKNNDALVVSNYEIVTWLGAQGVKGHPLNHGGSVKLDIGNVKYVNAIHTSALPDGSNGGQPGGFVVWNKDICYYHAGDTALTLDMKLIPMTCPKLDFAILPIGDNFTMGYKDAAIAAEFIECEKIIGCHYDTFGYIEIDHNAAKEAFSFRGRELILMEPESELNW